MDSDELLALGLDPGARAETLTLDEFVALARHAGDGEAAGQP